MTAVISFLWRFSLFYSNSFWSVGPNFRVSQIGSQFSSEIMQDGGEFFEIFVFFFQTIIAGNFIWPSHLSSPKCLHIRHKDIFFSPRSFSESFDCKIAKSAFGVVFSV